jgi:tetratricopeptide (TPR) repeat protein
MAYQSEVEKLEKQFQTNPDQYFAPLADAYRKAGNLDFALDIVRGGLAKRPNYLSAHIVLGRCLLDQKNDPEAARVFEHVLVLDAENIIALRYLGEITERSGDVAGAQRWLKRLLDVDPMNDDAIAALQRLESAAAAAPPPPPAPPEPEPAPEPEEAEPAPPVSGFEATAMEAVPGPPPSGGPANDFGIEQSSSPFETSGAKADMSALELESGDISFGGNAGAKLQFQEPEPEVAFDETRKSDGGAAFASAEPEPPPSYEPAMLSFEEPPPPAEPAPEPVAELTPAAPDPSELEPPAVRTSTPSFSSSTDLPLIMPEDMDEPPPAAPPSVEPIEPEPVITETMAEVYLRQGLLAEARNVYRKLVQKRPDDAALRDKLAALEQQRLTPPRGVPAIPATKPRFAATETGGVSARSLFGKVLSSRPGAAAASPPPASEPPAPATLGSPMDAAFAEDPQPAQGAPTRPTSDELSLAAVFGEDPAPPPPQKPDAAPAAHPPAGGPGFSFDEFFGGKREAPPPAGEASGGTEGEGQSPDDFVSWLKGLKS